MQISSRPPWVFVVWAVLLLVAGAGIHYVLTLPAPRTLTPIAQTAPASNITNTAPTPRAPGTIDYPTTNTQTTPTTSTVSLQVDWLSKPQPVSLTELFGKQRFAAFTAAMKAHEQPDYDPTTGQALKLGTVHANSHHTDFMVGDGVYAFASGPSQDFDGGFVWHRVLKGTNKEIIALPKLSYDFSPTESALLVDRSDVDMSIPDLVPPDSFIVNGVTMYRWQLQFGGSSTIEPWATDPELVPISHHPQYGTVYTTPFTYQQGISAAQPGHAFFIRLPDTSVVAYTFSIPFFSKGEDVPQLTWRDGTPNVTAYASTDVGGCGSQNAYAVRAESDVQPATRLVAGGLSSNGDTIYLLKDAQDKELKDLYDSYHAYLASGETKITYDAFVAKRPIFYWKDAFGRWIRFTRSDILPQAECGKPVIYLYPPTQEQVQVRVDLKGTMTKSEPLHGAHGWDVIAQPDGYAIADGKTYPNLYWEGTGVDYVTPKEGFVVKRSEADAWLAKTLAQIGFTARESAEFREFWAPRLPATSYVFITFVPQKYFDRDAALRISPRPDVVNRVFMEYRGLDAPEHVAPLALPKIIRRGFTVVEWGGALRK